MPRNPDAKLFKPQPSRMEAKGDATTRAARLIMDTEAAAERAKTARLKAARLAREALDAGKPAPARPAKGKR